MILLDNRNLDRSEVVVHNLDLIAYGVPESRVLRPVQTAFVVEDEPPRRQLRDLVRLLADCELVDMEVGDCKLVRQPEVGSRENGECWLPVAESIPRGYRFAVRLRGRVGYISSSSIWITCHWGGMCIAPTWINTVAEEAAAEIVAHHLAAKVGSRVQMSSIKLDLR